MTKEGEKINCYISFDEQYFKNTKRGKEVGVDYELENGEIIYVIQICSYKIT